MGSQTVVYFPYNQFLEINLVLLFRSKKSVYGSNHIGEKRKAFRGKRNKKKINEIIKFDSKAFFAFLKGLTYSVFCLLNVSSTYLVRIIGLQECKFKL